MRDVAERYFGGVNIKVKGDVFHVTVMLRQYFVSKVYALVQIGVLLVYLVLKLYNGEKGKAKWRKWFFYLYYPIHLILIGVLRICIYGDISLLF